MKKHFSFFMKSGLFLALLLALLSLANQICVPKYFYDCDWPTTSTYMGFYKMRRNSVDVLFLGSSHVLTSFSPQEIYDSAGICSYNLGSDQQNLLVSYYWLKEALRYQRPEAVVLDTYLCFAFDGEEPLNSAEACTRKAIDYMKWSHVKREAVSAICANDENQDAASYYFPMIRFHERWFELEENDFTVSEMSRHFEMKGYSLLGGRCGYEQYQPFQADSAGETEEMVPLMEEYLTKITNLCKENEIRLILVETPAVTLDIGKYNRISEYAAANQIEYYDFNEQTLYNETGYNLSEDNQDWGHPNYWGAKKLSLKMAEILKSGGQVSARADDQWEESRDFYRAMINNAELAYETDMIEYLEAVSRGNYTVLVAARDEASGAINEEIVERMHQLGLKEDLRGKLRQSYLAVISSGSVLEEAAGDTMLSSGGAFRNGRCTYSVSSAGYECGDTCSIMIDGEEYAQNRRGLNIVVYDNTCKKVVDSVCFDTCVPSLEAIRQGGIN